MNNFTKTHTDEKTKGRFPLPELTARVDGCQKMHPSSRAVNSARELGPWTRVVETDLNKLFHSDNYYKRSAVA